MNPFVGPYSLGRETMRKTGSRCVSGMNASGGLGDTEGAAEFGAGDDGRLSQYGQIVFCRVEEDLEQPIHDRSPALEAHPDKRPKEIADLLQAEG
ncbi:MAG: hypothetical protein ACQESR_22710 [Planctomycetota bacterium]